MSLVIEYVISLANVSTILLSAFNKVPQIRNVIKQQSATGLSISSVLMELTGYCITMSYFISNSYSLPSYLEYPLLVVQDVVLVLAVLWFSGQNLVLIGGVMGLQLGLGLSMIGGMFDDTVMTMLITSTTPISAFSKLVQLSSIVKSGSSKGVALTSWLISAYTCLTRMLTVYIATADYALLANFGISVFLNVAIISAIIIYSEDSSSIASKKTMKKKNK